MPRGARTLAAAQLTEARGTAPLLPVPAGTSPARAEAAITSPAQDASDMLPTASAIEAIW